MHSHITRPAISEKRLSRTNNGKIRYELETPYKPSFNYIYQSPYGCWVCGSHTACQGWFTSFLVMVTQSIRGKALLLSTSRSARHRFTQLSLAQLAPCYEYLPAFWSYPYQAYPVITRVKVEATCSISSSVNKVWKGKPIDRSVSCIVLLRLEYCSAW